jgi:pyrroline-5-carboxylate reductase
VIVVAVKPQVIDEVFPPLAKLAGKNTVVLSIAAGRTIAGFEKHLPKGTAVVRSMPNTPAAIGRGITVGVANAHVTPAQRAACDALLRAVGEVAWVDDEGCSTLSPPYPAPARPMSFTCRSAWPKQASRQASHRSWRRS